MKKDQNKERPLSDIFKSIDDSLNFVSDYPDYVVHQQAAKIKDDIKELKQGYKGMRMFILYIVAIAVISVITTIMMIINYEKASDLNQQLIQKSTPTKIDSIENELLYDKDGNMSYMTDDNDRIVSYKRVIEQRDSLKNRTLLFEDTLSDYKLKLNMAVKSYGIYYTEKKIKNSTYISIGSTKFEEMERSGQDSYKKLKPLVDSTLKK